MKVSGLVRLKPIWASTAPSVMGVSKINLEGHSSLKLSTLAFTEEQLLMELLAQEKDDEIPDDRALGMNESVISYYYP